MARNEDAHLVGEHVSKCAANCVAQSETLASAHAALADHMATATAALGTDSIASVIERLRDEVVARAAERDAATKALEKVAKKTTLKSSGVSKRPIADVEVAIATAHERQLQAVVDHHVKLLTLVEQASKLRTKPAAPRRRESDDWVEAMSNLENTGVKVHVRQRHSIANESAAASKSKKERSRKSYAGASSNNNNNNNDDDDDDNDKAATSPRTTAAASAAASSGSRGAALKKMSTEPALKSPKSR